MNRSILAAVLAASLLLVLPIPASAQAGFARLRGTATNAALKQAGRTIRSEIRTSPRIP